MKNEGAIQHAVYKLSATHVVEVRVEVLTFLLRAPTMPCNDARRCVLTGGRGGCGDS